MATWAHIKLRALALLVYARLCRASPLPVRLGSCTCTPTPHAMLVAGMLQGSDGVVKPAEMVPCSSAGTVGAPDGSCYSSVTRSGVVFTLQPAGKGVALSTALRYTCPVPGTQLAQGGEVVWPALCLQPGRPVAAVLAESTFAGWMMEPPT